MKTTAKIKSVVTLLAIVVCFVMNLNAQSQPKPVIAVLGIDSKGVIQDPEAVSYMVRLELEKTNVYVLLDKYDAAENIKKNNIDIKTCFGKNCVVAAGKTLNVDKVLTGNIDRFGEKIVISLKILDVKSEIVEKTNVTEYLNLQPELQKMIQISILRLVGMPTDPNVTELLVNFEAPIESPKTQIRLNGPRMGGIYTTGMAGKILQAPESEGGYNMSPAMFEFGWQQEWQYLSAGNFQALIEGIFLIGGLESGKFIPTVAFLNGFRFGKHGWEFGFGPTFRIIDRANGWYGDGANNTVDKKWYLEKDHPSPGEAYPVSSRPDSRGNSVLSTGLVIAVGKTFKSGYLNIPVNLFVSPRKDGTTYGFSFGFNIYRKPKVQ
ncbi:MAG: hypothetical protein WCO63_01720 [Bacteroidota bacterium]